MKCYTEEDGREEYTDEAKRLKSEFKELLRPFLAAAVEQGFNRTEVTHMLQDQVKLVSIEQKYSI